MHQFDPKILTTVLSAIVFIIFRWRWDYIQDYFRHPMQAFKHLLVWALLGLLVIRFFWQFKPGYFFS